MAQLICPECEEAAVAGRPRGANGGWALDVDAERLAHRHRDGEPLCPVVTGKGYQPALPKRL